MHKTKKQVLAGLLTIVLLMSLLTVPAFAAAQKASGNVTISMSYEIEEFYLAAEPHFYVYLEKTGTDTKPVSYFVKLKYNKKTKLSTATIKTPYIGKYNVKYYGAKAGKEASCDEAVKTAGLDPAEKKDLFKELTVSSDYAGGFMVLKTAPKTLTVNSGGGKLSVVSTHHTRRETWVPSAFVNISGIASTSALFDLDLYISDKNATPIEKIGTVGTTKATTAQKGYPRYFDAILAPAPGTYYFLGQERANGNFFQPGTSTLYTLNVGYQGDRMVPKKVSMKQGKALRSISVVGSSPISFTVFDNRATDASYYMYGPFDKSYPFEQEKSDGTYPGTKKKLTQNGKNFTGKITPTTDAWKTYVLVKESKSGINRGDTIYLSVNAVPFAGKTVTVWRLRVGATYTAVYKPVPPASFTFTKAVSSAAGQVTLQWAKKPDYDGYEIQYSQNANFSDPTKTIRILTGATTQQKVTNLASGKPYFFRIRTYRKANPTTKVYSKWSAKKKVVVK